MREGPAASPEGVPVWDLARLQHGQFPGKKAFMSTLERYENAAVAVFSTPRSCLTTNCPTHCSPAHANLRPMRMHRLILGSIHSDKPFIECKQSFVVCRSSQRHYLDYSTIVVLSD